MTQAPNPKHLTQPLSEAEETRLIERLRLGEEDAYAALVRLYGGRMLAVAHRFFPNEEDGGDVVQEAFLQAFRAIGRFEGQARLATWLHRITVNAALMKLRTRRRRPEESIEDLLPKFLEDGHQAHPAQSWREPADQAAERKEVRELVLASIHKLPENYRNVLLLRDIEELDTRTVAQLLGLSPNAVKIRLHRARQALRTLLDPHFRQDAAC